MSGEHSVGAIRSPLQCMCLPRHDPHREQSESLEVPMFVSHAIELHGERGRDASCVTQRKQICYRTKLPCCLANTLSDPESPLPLSSKMSGQLANTVRSALQTCVSL